MLKKTYIVQEQGCTTQLHMCGFGAVLCYVTLCHAELCCVKVALSAAPAGNIPVLQQF